MKPQILFAAAALLIMSFTPAAVQKKQGKLNIAWKFENITAGYDHQNKCRVWVDGKDMGYSEVFKESDAKANMQIKADKGLHKIKIMNYALYNGNWEEHTVANTYSIDASWEGELSIAKKSSITLAFDLHNGTSAVTK